MGNNFLDPLGLRFLLDPLGLRRLADPTGLAGLNEDGALSVFNPKNPVREAIADHFTRGRTPLAPGTDPKKLNPADRRPPQGPVPDDERSLMLERAHKSLLPAQVGETEWWWHSLHLTATSDTDTRELSLIANVQLIGTSLPSPSIEAMCAIRDAESGEKWSAETQGDIADDRGARFDAEGWQVARDEPSAAHPNGCMRLSIDRNDFKASLTLEQGPALKWGDEGWIDCNPNGAIPYWATYKSRMQTATGTISLRVDGQMKTYDVTGNGEFDHQTIHNSLRDASRDMSLGDVVPALNEASTVRPKWNWYRANLNDGLCLMGFHLWNENTGTENTTYGAIGDAAGRVLQIDPATIAFKAARYDEGIPVDMEMKFIIATGTATVPAGDYRLVFHYPTDIDWNVKYQTGAGIAVDAHGASGSVEIWRDGKRLADGSGAQETIDIDILGQLERKGFKPHQR